MQCAAVQSLQGGSLDNSTWLAESQIYCAVFDLPRKNRTKVICFGRRLKHENVCYLTLGLDFIRRVLIKPRLWAAPHGDFECPNELTPLVWPRALLVHSFSRQLVPARVRLNEHLEHDCGQAVFQHACKMGLEGIVSKRLGSRYRSGRSPDWRIPRRQRSAARRQRSAARRKRIGRNDRLGTFGAEEALDAHAQH
jgi:hypothetical protein